jgi:hypothetical protein
VSRPGRGAVRCRLRPPVRGARTRALTPAGSHRLGAVMSAVITCGDCPATAASSPVASLALVMSISVGMVTAARRTGQATHRRPAASVCHAPRGTHPPRANDLTERADLYPLGGLPVLFAPKAIGGSPAGQRQAAASGQSLQRTALRRSGECLVRQCSNRLARPAGSPDTSPWADLGTQRKSDHHSARRMPGC